MSEYLIRSVELTLIGGPSILTWGQGIKLYTVHEYWLVCPTHLLFRFNRKLCEKRHCLSCTLVHLRPPQLWRYTGLLRRALNRLVENQNIRNAMGDRGFRVYQDNWTTRVYMDRYHDLIRKAAMKRCK